ncbi:DMT family transporter [Alkaliphilus serpentinus]|uniref:Transporter family-2 protein n=1 Tax=Alkaliphilus serpentinus TaxID=1482731 RepID=A0A833M989_9FIRM|nr:DMT family transporter [Alkaliphilus serpentinus]KAB3529245.1 hypothetical protein F8153_09565 [Alkaliphilus serpentinus]
MSKNFNGLLILLLFMGLMNSGIVLINGMLAQYTNLYLAGLMVHIIGLIPAFILYLIFDRSKFNLWKSTFLEDKKLFIGGFIGSLILIISAFSMGTVGVFITSISMVAGQFLLSVIVDTKGLFGFKRVTLGYRKISGIIIIILGIILISI